MVKENDCGLCIHKDINGNTEIGNATEDIVHNISLYDVDSQYVDKIKKVLFEAEKNIRLYAQKGEIEVKVTKDMFKAKIKDVGPGIDNIGLAFEDGFTTANDNVKKLGYGKGTGLGIISNNADYLNVASIVGVGTTLDIEIDLTEK